MVSIPVMKQRAKFAPELSVAILTGGFDLIGTLVQNPVQIIFDNQSTVSIGLSDDGVTIGKTFSPGESIVLDMRGNHGLASNFTFDIGTHFYAVGAAGANPFRISYTYAR